ncbi:MAG: hypothetical protein ACR2KD_03115, partial [Thermoleophilaceae bacterium]
MASVSRPIVIALIGAALIVVTFLATRVGAEEGAQSAPPPSADTSEPDGGARGANAPDSPRPAPAPSRAGAREVPSRAAPGPRRSTPGTRPKPPGELSGMALDAARALERGKVVVVLFTQRGADDDATLSALRELSVKRSPRVAVFRDRVSNLTDYGPLAAGLGISRAPSVVVVDRDHRVRVLEGYLDRGSLRQ